jgi:voltage-gated potassium channel Kch
MGALVAGVALSAFPYNLDVIAKVINVRDFFVPLFFVALGMQIQAPSAADLAVAFALAGMLIVSRLLTVFPPLYLSGAGLRPALLPTINLAQMSEFSLVIAALGASLGHIRGETVAVLTLVFALTSVSSTYAIAYNHELQGWLSRLLRGIGLREKAAPAQPEPGQAARSELVLLGFYQDASAIVHQLEIEAEGSDGRSLLPDLLVIDFNPAVLEELKRRGIRGVYGDVASMDTLHHASLAEARLVVCTLTDSILKGTTNARLLQQVRRLSPSALAVVSSDTLTGALALYEAGADFVYVPRLHSAYRMVEVLRAGIEEGLQLVRQDELASLRARREILA